MWTILSRKVKLNDSEALRHKRSPDGLLLSQSQQEAESQRSQDKEMLWRSCYHSKRQPDPSTYWEP